MADGFTLVLDDQKVYEAIQDGEGTPKALGEIVQRIAGNANALSAGFRTGYFYDRKVNKRKGGTAARYAANVERRGRSQVGLVYTANYAAQKDNHEHNTLLKSIG